MKKRFKLFTTVAAMCLSLALLAFGVFAAVTVNYSLSGKISYDVEDAYVVVTTSIKKGVKEFTTADTSENLMASYAADTTVPEVVDFDAGTDGDQTSHTWSSYEYVDGTEKLVEVPDLEFVAADLAETDDVNEKKTVFYFEIKVVNEGNDAIYVYLDTADAGYLVAENTFVVGAPVLEIGAKNDADDSDEGTYVIALALDNKRVEMVDLEYKLPVKISITDPNA